MKTLKESLLDDEEDMIKSDFFDDPEYFKLQLLLFSKYKNSILPFYFRDIITLCEDIYNSKFGPDMTDTLCEDIIHRSNVFMFTNLNKLNKEATNYIIMMLNKILYTNKGLFGIDCPLVKNNRTFYDPVDFDLRQLPYPGLKDAWNIMFDIKDKINTGKIKQPIIDVMEKLNVLNKDTASYTKSSKYRVVLRNMPSSNEQGFSIMWIPNTLPSNYKKMLDIIFKELK